MRILRYLRLATPLLLLAPVAAAPAPASAAVFVSVAIAPPALPVYVQPPIPGPGYIWTPGYWAYGPGDYYWVPGTWVLPPAVGLLWTPGYWGWGSGVYVWHAGYWGPHIGFYGGVNYGFGYFGTGFVGGYWAGQHFFYNSAYANFGGVHITNVYNRTVNVENVNHVSYNGGTGGINREASAEERSAERDRHVDATSAQTHHERVASNNPQLRNSFNHGNPTITASSRPGQFGGTGNGGANGQKGTGGSKTHTNNAHTNNARTNNARTNNARTNNPHPNNPHPSNANATSHNQPHSPPPKGGNNNRGNGGGNGEHKGG